MIDPKQPRPSCANHIVSLRNGLHYRLIDDPRITSPIILTHRINDNGWCIDAIKPLVADMYAEKTGLAER